MRTGNLRHNDSLPSNRWNHTFSKTIVSSYIQKTTTHIVQLIAHLLFEIFDNIQHGKANTDHQI